MTEWLALAKAWALTRPDQNAIAFHVLGYAPTVPAVFMTVLAACAAVPPLGMIYIHYIKGQKAMQILITLGTLAVVVGGIAGVLYWFDASEPKPEAREDQIHIER